MVKQGTIDVCVTTRNILYAFVNTFKCRTMMDIITTCNRSFWHKVAIILSGPGGRTCGLCWDHQDCLTCWCQAHSAWEIVFMCAHQEIHTLLHTCNYIHPHHGKREECIQDPVACTGSLLHTAWVKWLPPALSSYTNIVPRTSGQELFSHLV